MLMLFWLSGCLRISNLLEFIPKDGPTELGETHAAQFRDRAE